MDIQTDEGFASFLPFLTAVVWAHRVRDWRDGECGERGCEDVTGVVILLFFTFFSSPGLLPRSPEFPC